MKTNRQKKETIVASILDDANKAKSVVFLDFQGMTHKQLEVLKKSIKPLKAEILTSKNTLIKIALNKSDNKAMVFDKKEEVLKEKLKGPTAIMFSFEDEIAAFKELAKTIKAINLPSIKFGILGGRELTGTEVLKIASLPSREILLAQAAAGLKSPIFGLHRALNWNMQKFVMTLKAIESKKTGGEK